MRSNKAYKKRKVSLSMNEVCAFVENVSAVDITD